uniref:Uncharacterized protein n=1 Tax=Glossina brevipalpis TaxID=37001 RepID=A0A1A9X3G5_9MUSC
MKDFGTMMPSGDGVGVVLDGWDLMTNTRIMPAATQNAIIPPICIILFASIFLYIYKRRCSLLKRLHTLEGHSFFEGQPRMNPTYQKFSVIIVLALTVPDCTFLNNITDIIVFAYCHMLCTM